MNQRAADEMADRVWAETYLARVRCGDAVDTAIEGADKARSTFEERVTITEDEPAPAAEAPQAARRRRGH